MNTASNNYIESIINNFKLPKREFILEKLSEGKIHDTFLISFTAKNTSEKFILQKINTRVFKNPETVMHNFNAVSKHLKKRKIRTIEIIKTKKNKLFYNNTIDNSYWRVTAYIKDGKSSSFAKNKAYAFEAGVLLGSFQKSLHNLSKNDLKNNLNEFHNPMRYLRKLNKLLSRSKELKNKVKKVLKLINEKKYIINVFEKNLKLLKTKKHICHNDPKFNNMLFDDKGKGLCMIDLDTVEFGYYYYDFGDAVRSICKSFLKGKTFIFNFAYFKAFSNGYLKIMRDMYNKEEVICLFLGAKVIALELSIRYLIDYLSDKKCFLLKNNNEFLKNALNQLNWLNDAEKYEEKAIYTLLSLCENK